MPMELFLHGVVLSLCITMPKINIIWLWTAQNDSWRNHFAFFCFCMSLIWFLTALSADTSVYHAMAFDWDSLKMIKPFSRTNKFFYNKGADIYVWISDFWYWLFLPQKVLRTQNVQVFINRAAIQRVWDANIAQPFLLSFNHCGVFPVAAMSYHTRMI